MTEEASYTIGELAEAAGVTPRTVRYYTAEGLLPAPDTRGRYALYTIDHLARLRLIARLKDAYLPLSEIKARMEQLDGEEVRQLLASYTVEPQPPAASAADYIAQVLSTPGQPPAAPRMLAESAVRYQGAMEPPGGGSPPAPAPAGESIGAGTIPIGFATPPAPAAAQGGLLKRLVPRRREQAVQPSAAEPAPKENWQRMTLAPGVELHVREPLTPGLRERVARLIAWAHELFDERPTTNDD